MALRWAKTDQNFALCFSQQDRAVHRLGSEGWSPHVYSQKLPNQNSTFSLQIFWEGNPICKKGRRFSIGIVPVQYGFHLDTDCAKSLRGVMIGGQQNRSIGVRWLLKSNVVSGSCTSYGDISSANGELQRNACGPVKSGDRIDFIWRPQQGHLSFALNGICQGCTVHVDTKSYKYTIGAVLSPDMILEFVDFAKKLDTNDAKSHVTRCMQVMWKDRTFTDAIVKCGDHTWHVHRGVLAAASPVFSRMFESEFKEGRTSTIEIKDGDQEIMGAILEFVYTGELHLDQNEEAKDSHEMGLEKGGSPVSQRTGSSAPTEGKGKNQGRAQTTKAGKNKQPSPHSAYTDKLKNQLTALMEQSHLYGLDDLTELSTRKLMDNRMVDASNIAQLIRIVRNGCNAGGTLKDLERLIKMDSQLLQALMQSV